MSWAKSMNIMTQFLLPFLPQCEKFAFVVEICVMVTFYIENEEEEEENSWKQS